VLALPSPKTNPAAAAAASKPQMPGEVVRGLVSLWLLIHFFGIGLALMAGTPMGRSELIARVKRAPILNQYLYALWLDWAHAYGLTSGQTDGNYSIETELVYADGHHSEPTNLQPPNAHGERLERYQAMAIRAAPILDAESPDTTVVNQLGAAIIRGMKEDGVKEVIFRVLRHAPLSMADAASNDPGQRDPAAQRTKSTMYTASVILDSNGDPQVQVKSQSARDVAPVTNPATPSANRQPGSRAPMPEAPKPSTIKLDEPRMNLEGNTPGTSPNVVPPVGNPASDNSK
jgi:hypothetical protein